MTENIFLIGLMGAGKSTIGKQLARELGKDFRDSDSEIEKRTGVSIDVIFDIEGEPGFRRRETGMLRELVEKRGIVLATGGGAVLAPENRQLLRDNGLIILPSGQRGTPGRQGQTGPQAAAAAIR